MRCARCSSEANTVKMIDRDGNEMADLKEKIYEMSHGMVNGNVRLVCGREGEGWSFSDSDM
jgi:hypothetical protein